MLRKLAIWVYFHLQKGPLRKHFPSEYASHVWKCRCIRSSPTSVARKLALWLRKKSVSRSVRKFYDIGCLIIRFLHSSYDCRACCRWDIFVDFGCPDIQQFQVSIWEHDVVEALMYTSQRQFLKIIWLRHLIIEHPRSAWPYFFLPY